MAPTPQTPTDALEPRLLWDAPTRILHGAMAALFTAAFSIALLASEHSPAFVLHSALGLLLGGVVLVRLVWGLVGSRPSRFGTFLHSPAALLRYLREAWRGADRPVAGHNPGAGYAAWAMLLLSLGLAGTGLAMGAGQGWAEEVHEALAYTLLGVVVLHLAGLAWHTLRHREAIALSMVHGRRRIDASGSIPSSRPVAAVLVTLTLAGAALLVAKGLDTGQGTLALPGLARPLVLKGEDREGGEGHHRATERHESED